VSRPRAFAHGTPRALRDGVQGSSFFVCTLDGCVEHSSKGIKLAEIDRQRVISARTSHAAQAELSIGAARIVLLEPDRVLVIVKPTIGKLTSRQRQVAEYAAAGATAAEIARCLALSSYTVRQHLKAVYRALHVGNRIELSHALGD
jgi:DNA-binding NarL/FixJ family response regulator